ncbi:pilus biosynthesis protein TadE [Rhodococcus sp. BP-332]|uniref:TadE family type IV pilus minor pilin n=1 Tax=Rhodococcus sp. BP-332 TaxID=2739447 RepID=UPI001C9A9715|nr:TadE family type IV pilus minor pilin [Rhodococcus sp. BP-332]MBY6678494.1 pilus biosynthesis protein TadE [Rhodococcus sp. BP-332]
MTVEAALAISSIVAVLVLCLGALVTVTEHIRCIDAAREGARLSALGDESAVTSATVVAPPGARVTVTRVGDLVTVRVESSSPLPGLTVSASAVATAEPTDG